MYLYQDWSMDLPKIDSQPATEWFNTILLDSGTFRPGADFRGIWIGLEGELITILKCVISDFAAQQHC